MSFNTHQQCAVCAWRETCAKKHTIKESALNCPDFSRDRALGDAPEDQSRAERHKQVEDVFGD